MSWKERDKEVRGSSHGDGSLESPRLDFRHVPGCQPEGRVTGGGLFLLTRGGGGGNNAMEGSHKEGACSKDGNAM